MSTFHPKAGDITHSWYVIDASDVVLGRLAVQAANLLRGKHKPTFAPNVDGGDYVIIINADKVALTGNKLADKKIYRHSGHPGGLKSRTAGEIMANNPEKLVQKAVLGMIPRNKLGSAIGLKLKVYAGPTHPHVGQQPTPFVIKQVAQ